MSKRVALVVAMLIGAGAGRAVAQHEHLEPEDGAFSQGFRSDAYDAAVRETLVPTPFESFLVVTLPSNRREWAAWVEMQPQPRACSRIVASTIWAGLESEPRVPAEPPTPRCAPVAGKVARAVAAGWIAMLRGTHYPEPDNRVRFDGVTYHFSGFSRGQGRLAGHTWSPDPNTDAGRLVALAEALRAYSLAPSEGGERTLCDLASALPAASRDPSERCK